VCGFLLVNGLDDLFIDANYYIRGLFRRNQRRISVKDLKEQPQKRIAIMIPAWQEANVIQHMLELNLSQLDYASENLDIFVGTYINDPATQERVQAVARTLPNVHCVVTPHEGPTCKADNLNWIYQGLRLVEEQRGQRFDILLMHDAEDIIHPLALRLYNYFIPKYEFIQTPVFPLNVPWTHWVAGTYIDEFTEHHLKDMLVRESVGGLVPSAGVGSAFERDAFEDIALKHSQEAFNPVSLTEDYEIGMKFRLGGKRSYFLNRAVSRIREVEKGVFRKRMVREAVDEYIATREYFPNTLKTSVRQRSRWVLGIALQTWDQLGWKGPPAVQYCLWRDRKALLTSYVGPLAYLLAFYCIARFIMGLFTGHPWDFGNVFVPGSWLWYMVLLNTILLIWRAVAKVIAVEEIFGPFQALLALPRFFASNVINVAATTLAVWQFTKHKITGRPLRWLKTTHEFPNVEALRSYQRWLGELLVDREGLTREELDQALELHRQTGIRLGEVCAQAGFADQDVVMQALSDQLALEVHKPNPNSVPLALLQQLPEAEAEALGVLPFGIEENGAIQLVTSRPPTKDVYATLEERFKARVSFSFCLDKDLALARQRSYRRLLQHASVRRGALPTGEQLVRAGMLSRADLEQALAAHDPGAEPFGEYLVRVGLVSAQQISRFLQKRFQETFRQLSPEDGDPGAMRRLGFAFCCLNGIVPLRPLAPNAPVPLAASRPLHDQIQALVSARLGSEIEPVLAPALDVRMLLAVNARKSWPEGTSEGAGGLDGVELGVLATHPDLKLDLRALYLEALSHGLAPIDHLEASGRVDAERASRLRAQVYGIPIVQASQITQEQPPQLLPESANGLDKLWVVDLHEGSLVVATPRPSPMLAARLAMVLPDTAVAWRVLIGEPARPSPTESPAPTPAQADQPPQARDS
jgi:adsorption protein B